MFKNLGLEETDYKWQSDDGHTMEFSKVRSNEILIVKVDDIPTMKKMERCVYVKQVAY